MRRGEVWWVDFPEPTRRRPAVVLTRDSACGVRSSLTVGPITGTIRSIPVEVPLGPEQGLSVECVANLDDILTVPKKYFDKRITVLPAIVMEQVEKAIVLALDIRID
ncbi:MAG: type II toxin-antitoxin system PemK/MazF family toxin [Actinobacteria bacterium]|nr:type II toxin-antitoxin system PemK/MazF family toxin [Actinomycetota bacterium]